MSHPTKMMTFTGTGWLVEPLQHAHSVAVAWLVILPSGHLLKCMLHIETDYFEACSNLHALPSDSLMKMCKAGRFFGSCKKLLAHNGDMACSVHGRRCGKALVPGRSESDAHYQRMREIFQRSYEYDKTCTQKLPTIV